MAYRHVPPRHDKATQTYAARRRAEGKTNKEILRCLKRYIAREVFRLLTNPPSVPDIALLRARRAFVGITLAAVANHLGTTPIQISRLEAAFSTALNWLAATRPGSTPRRPTTLLDSHRSIQGAEMAKHASFTIDTGIAVYFCDPHSPWQRPSNENTNGLLRHTCPRAPICPY